MQAKQTESFFITELLRALNRLTCTVTLLQGHRAFPQLVRPLPEETLKGPISHGMDALWETDLTKSNFLLLRLLLAQSGLELEASLLVCQDPTSGAI